MLRRLINSFRASSVLMANAVLPDKYISYKHEGYPHNPPTCTLLSSEEEERSRTMREKCYFPTPSIRLLLSGRCSLNRNTFHVRRRLLLGIRNVFCSFRGEPLIDESTQGKYWNHMRCVIGAMGGMHVQSEYWLKIALVISGWHDMLLLLNKLPPIESNKKGFKMTRQPRIIKKQFSFLNQRNNFESLSSDFTKKDIYWAMTSNETRS